MELLRGLYSQSRVVRALAIRETRTRFGNQRIGYMWALLEPSIWIVTFYGMFAIADRQAPAGMDMVSMLATGIVPYEVFGKCTERCSNAIDANKSLLFYPQVQVLDIIYARTLLEYATYSLVLVVIMGVYSLFGGGHGPDDILSVIAGITLAALLGAVLGLVFCVLAVSYPSVDRIRGPLLRPLFWISGVFFTANSLPTPALEVLKYNPLLHCVELVRGGWFVAYTPRTMDAAYVGWWIIVLAFIGLTVERSVRSKVQLT